MTETPKRYACRMCTRDDLSLTANGRVRSHAANGKRPGPDNPNCPGGSDSPRTVEPEVCFHPDGCVNRVGRCSACGADLRPAQADVDDAMRVGDAPFEVEEAAFELIDRAGKYGIRPDHDGPNPYRAPLPTGNLPHDRQTEPANWREAVGPARAYGTEQTEDPWQSATPSNQPTRTGTDQVPGSRPGSTETVTAAGSPFTKVTSSGQTETAGTRDRTAAVTTEAAAPADAFESAAPVQKAEPKRDRYGRYMLPHPVTGKRQGWTRATTMAKSISDTFALSQWSQRMTAKGLALRPDLVSLAGTLDVKNDKDKLNHLVDQAKDAAGQKVAANLGTTLHTHTENVDAGAPLDSVPPNHRADVAAYRAAMAEAGLIAVPHLIERITVVPQFDTAGTFDRVLQTADGDYVIGDLKSGRDLQYGWQEIAIQLALYAQGVNESGVYDLAEERWELPDTFEHTMGVAGSPKVRTDYGIVMHLPVGESRCTLYRVDLTAGWAAATLCARVRDWRKTRNLAEPYVVAEAQNGTVTAPPVAVRPPTWAEKFEAVSSRGEAMSLYTEALGVLGQGPELDSLVRLGLAKLAGTEERAG